MQLRNFTSLVTLSIAALLGQHAAAIEPRATNYTALVESAGLSKGSKVYTPSSTNWANKTERWTIHEQPTYTIAVRPALESDVQKLVKLAAKHNIPFLATGGGHGFSTTLGGLQNGMMIDLSAFKGVSVDKEASTVTVGGATLFKEIYDPIFKAGKEINTGSDPCVGLVGAAIGGGIGRYCGLHGMIVDQLASVRMVTGQGDIITASTTENSDLFWAIRGAGYAYGIITEATFIIYDLTSTNVANADILLPLNATLEVMRWIKSFEDNQPPELSILAYAHYDNSTSDYAGLAFDMNVVYAGAQSELERLLKPLLNKTTPLKQNIVTAPWNRLIYTSFFGALDIPNLCYAEKGVNSNDYGGSVDTYDIPSFVEYFKSMQKFYDDYPDARKSIFFIEQFGKKKTLEIPESSTSYPWRNITAHLLWNFGYPAGDSELEDAVNKYGQKSRALLQASSGFNPQQIYANYAHGDEAPSVLYSAANLPKLRQLKKRWDPRNMFRFYNPVA